MRNLGGSFRVGVSFSSFFRACFGIGSLLRKWQRLLISALIAAIILTVTVGSGWVRQSAAQENNSAALSAPAAQFCNAGSISIPFVGTANPYPSNVNVSGLTGVTSSVSVTLNNIQHFTAADVDILLVSPDGRKFVIMSDIGDLGGLDSPATLTLSDAGATDLLNTPIPIPSGTYKPTNLGSGDTFASPAPSAPYNEPAPAGSATFASVFNNANPNGIWSLYVLDDSNGSNGNIAGGWCLNITSAAPSPGQLQFSASNYNGIAPNTATVTVNRVSGGSGAVTVDYATSGGSATGGAFCGAGVDYISASGTLSFANGESSKTFTVQLCPDATSEPNETVNVTLSNPTGGATIGTPGTATVTVYTTGTTPCDITWRKVDNPHVISGTVTIPAGQNVCIEPGVIVQWADNSQLNLFGRLTGTGTSGERIMFNHANAGPNRIEVIGTLDLQFADIKVVSNINAGGSLLCRNCNFGEVGEIVDTSINIGSLPTRFVQIEDSVFDSNAATQGSNAQLFVAGVTAILRNVSFRNGAFCIIGNSYIYFDNVTSENSLITGLSFSQFTYQPLYLNNLTITNSARAGLSLGNGNFEIGPNVVVQNTEYPVSGKGGLMPGSQVPSTGNRNNWIEVGQANATGTIYAPVSLPYVVDSFSDIGGIQFLPGARFKARSTFHFNTESGPVRMLGLPEAPVVFEPFIAGQKWNGGQFNSSGDRMEYVTLDGSQNGIIDAVGNNATFYIDNSILRNHDTAIHSPAAFLQGDLFTNNTTAIRATGLPSAHASGKKNSNLFENNTTAVQSESGANPDVRYNWWNSPTGPTTPQNPGGTGDLITGNATFQPFRTTRPDTTDHPPIVRMPRVPYHSGEVHGILEAGTRVILSWKASDDHAIVKQRILFSPSGNARNDFTIMADNLPGSQREFEMIVPSVGFQVSGAVQFVRVVAIDDKGQEGWDEWQVLIPSGEETGELQITSNVAGQTFRGGQEVPFTWIVTAPFQNPSFTCYLILDADRDIIDLGGGSNGQSFLPPVMPNISTDSARFAIVDNGGLNRVKWFYSEPFAIRPDSRWPDAAPQITLMSPAAGQEFPAGSVVPITWSAADDEALRQFNIQVSSDSGRTWIQIAENLPPTATSYDWKTPTGGSLNDVRVRVIAVDRRFQNSSDGATRAFRLTSPRNAAPSVQVTFPANGANYHVGDAIFVAADARDSDGTLQRVEFYQTNNSTGVPTTTLIGSDATAPYQIGWNRPSALNYTLTARAIDNRNAVTVSAPINVTVQPGNPAPLPIGAPELSSPEDSQMFNPGANITLSALPSPSSYSTVRIEFYNGTTLLGSDNTAPYEFVWNSVPEGRYTVFAKTVASNGAEAISKPADISVGISQQTRRSQFDFDGDGLADQAVFRPSDTVWYSLGSGSGFTAAQFGLSSDKIVPADYDGDGKTDIAVFRDGTWYWLNSSNGSFNAYQFGIAGDIPVPADFTGDGRAELAVYRSGVWYTLNLASNQFQAVQFGLSTDKPVPADFDGDGKTDVAVYRPESGYWYMLRSTQGFGAVQFGIASDKPVVGDYDGDGKADQAVYRSGVWYVLGSVQGFTAVQFGLASDIPVAADYDGDGKTDLAVYRPDEGVWYSLRSQQGFSALQFGTTNDRPIPAAFVP